MGNTNTYRSRVFYFEDMTDMTNFILLYGDLFHPYSPQTKDYIIVFGLDTDDYRDWYVDPKNEKVREMMNKGYVIRNHSMICLLEKEDLEEILYKSGLRFEEVRVSDYRKLYKYGSGIGA